VLLTFLIGKRLFDERTGFIAAFLCSLNGLIIETSGGRAATDHYDVLYLFLFRWAFGWHCVLQIQKKRT
jgi:4-amino-4-deoxy-L-arabinose transferase